MSRVQSIERAFVVLSALAEGPLGVPDVADRARLPKSTAARMLASLAREGAVEQGPGATTYRLGPRLLTLASGLRSTRGLVATAHPFLAELAERTGRAWPTTPASISRPIASSLSAGPNGSAWAGRCPPPSSGSKTP